MAFTRHRPGEVFARFATADDEDFVVHRPRTSARLLRSLQRRRLGHLDVTAVCARQPGWRPAAALPPVGVIAPPPPPLAGRCERVPNAPTSSFLEPVLNLLAYDSRHDCRRDYQDRPTDADGRGSGCGDVAGIPKD